MLTRCKSREAVTVVFQLTFPVLRRLVIEGGEELIDNALLFEGDETAAANDARERVGGSTALCVASGGEEGGHEAWEDLLQLLCGEFGC